MPCPIVPALLRRLGLVVGIAILASPAGAASDPRPCEPEAVVRALYRAVQRQPQPSSLDVIRPFADKGLKALLAKEKACAKKEVCAVDFDILTSSQDFDRITLVSVSTEAAAGLETAHAVVDTGMAKPLIDFLFSRKGACVELTDVKATQGDDTWSLKAMLTDYHHKKK